MNPRLHILGQSVNFLDRRIAHRQAANTFVAAVDKDVIPRIATRRADSVGIVRITEPERKVEFTSGIEAVDVVPALRDLAVAALELRSQHPASGKNRICFDEAKLAGPCPDFEFLLLLKGPYEKGLRGIRVKRFSHCSVLRFGASEYEGGSCYHK